MRMTNPAADTQTTPEPSPAETILVAHVTVHLRSGEAFDLLPFRDELDVKSQVTALIEDWCKSGYLLRGNRIYPWHEVKSIEATKVEELTKGEANQRMLEFETLDLAHLQQSFWKTKQPRDKKQEEKTAGGEAKGPAPG
jgi:hypothetical protein